MKYKPTKIQNTFALLSEMSEAEDPDKPDNYEAEALNRAVKPTCLNDVKDSKDMQQLKFQ